MWVLTQSSSSNASIVIYQVNTFLERELCAMTLDNFLGCNSHEDRRSLSYHGTFKYIGLQIKTHYVREYYQRKFITVIRDHIRGNQTFLQVSS